MTEFVVEFLVQFGYSIDSLCLRVLDEGVLAIRDELSRRVVKFFFELINFVVNLSYEWCNWLTLILVL